MMMRVVRLGVCVVWLAAAGCGPSGGHGIAAAQQTEELSGGAGAEAAPRAPAAEAGPGSVGAAPTAASEASAAAADAGRDAGMASVLDALAQDRPETFGVVVEDLTSGARHALNEDSVFRSGSVYKLPLAWEVLRRVDAGQMSLDDPLPIQPSDIAEVEPYGGFDAGESPTLREAMHAMLSVSSNSAAHAILRVIGRRQFNESVNSVGLGHTRVPQEAEGGDGDDGSEASTSAGDIARLLRMLASGEKLSQASQQELRAALALGGSPDALRETLPPDVQVLDKTGNLDQASNVGALLSGPRGTVILVVLDDGIDPGDARAVIARLGMAAHDAYLADAF
jgi:beta-lactamase class A